MIKLFNIMPLIDPGLLNITDFSRLLLRFTFNAGVILVIIKLLYSGYSKENNRREFSFSYFAIGLSVINALTGTDVSYRELIFTNLIIIVALWILEIMLKRRSEKSLVIEYEKIENIPKGKEEKYLRYRGKVDYNIKGSPFTPYCSMELFHHQAEKNNDKLRYMPGVTSKFNKVHSIDDFFIFQDYPGKEKNRYIFGISCKIKLQNPIWQKRA